MSRRNRNSRRGKKQTIEARALAAVQTPVQPGTAGTVGGFDGRAIAADVGAEALRVVETLRPPRPFGKPRVYQLDGGYTVTIEGDADALEQEFSVSAENDQLRVFTADAAIERRIARQSGSDQVRLDPIRSDQVRSAPQRSQSAIPPPGIGGPVHVPGVAYDGTGPRPRSDFQEELLRDAGMDANALAAMVGGSPQLLANDVEEPQ
jgi:hypothetical protein